MKSLYALIIAATVCFANERPIRDSTQNHPIVPACHTSESQATTLCKRYDGNGNLGFSKEIFYEAGAGEPIHSVSYSSS